MAARASSEVRAIVSLKICDMHDELRADVKNPGKTFWRLSKQPKPANAAVQELDEADTSDGPTPGGEFTAAGPS